MKCRICGKVINFVVFGALKDVCYGCLTKDERDEHAVREERGGS